MAHNTQQSIHSDVSLSAEDDDIVVLHVDDEPHFRELVTSYLERHNDNITVITETDPSEALGRLQDERIDCVVSDHQMPGMTGIELLEAVREEYPNLPFFLFTGRGSEDVAAEAIEAGVTSYLQKGGSEVYGQLANRIQNAVNRRQSERRAKVARSRLLSLYEQTDGFYILDSHWQVVYWNQQIADRTGIPREEILGEVFWDMFEPAAEMEIADHFHHAMNAGEPTEFETYYEPFDYWAEVRAYPVSDGLFIHSRDISTEKERETDLERRNNILESFANTVSHDLRNPLNVAEGKLQLAQETGDFEHLEEVAQAHNRMRNLIDELLRLARGEELQYTAVAVSEIAQEAWETVTSESVELTVETDAQIQAHESQLRRLFENLYWNAIDHGNASRIRVGRLEQGGLFVEDDGMGIPTENREEVFEKGFSTEEGSPGYGLSIVEGIVESHGWSISVTDGELGGARFEITEIERS
jgi:PAS domain S-box-containing protein